MNYNLNELQKKDKKPVFQELKGLVDAAGGEQRNLVVALLIMLLNTALNLSGPLLVGYTIDHYIQTKQFDGVLLFSGILLALYVVVFGGSYLQTRLMGSAAQRIVFGLRNAVFHKIQALPIAFFNQNKAGDLISRVNSDTDRLNQFFSQALLQFVSNIFMLVASGSFMLIINFKLGVVTVLPALCIWLFVNRLSPWVRKRNAANLESVGLMSGEIQESLNNFKIVVAFNRRDYFRKRFNKVNQQNYKTATGAGIANTVFMPVFSLFSNIAQLLLLIYGVYLIHEASLTVGLLISFFAYANSFYNPIRQLATLWTSFQTALASWDRISLMLGLSNDLEVVADGFSTGQGILKDTRGAAMDILEFREVHFGYPGGKEILHNISFRLERGKMYAFVGPTGGGKTTTASLMARLYDPLSGLVLLNGRDIRSYTPDERASRIGFILQEPLLFTGTVRDNILYGNERYTGLDNIAFMKIVEEAGLGELLAVFDKGLETAVASGGASMSLGQKQLVAFMRAFLRKPELLILDEATANIDTVTEQMLDRILDKLPSETTLVIIAHRLNTIENADEIFFVNSGEVVRAGSFKDAVEKLMMGKRES
ncbi:ABC transporter ATP-binding protein [Pedobacter psychroterrae]|uniref:ABC transporter ATP-binding protein n=1 Tax=Pedobacter psychroterrae TaxID=2530453 RepID=A0A4V2MKB7_9SPHI|nr:ABC transporter ATP-binding protein [Pedobacter psychroterrae]TCC97336.1 ABC transporter ATP-binding protein [Pedobacter psychroterrae]